MKVPEQKGKRRIINALSPDVSDVNIDQFQKIMKRANNCHLLSAWKCSSCKLPQLRRCFAKAQHEIQMMAFLKYRDRPEWKREQEKIDKKKK